MMAMVYYDEQKRYHRLDGPAVKDGPYEEWYQHGLYHRLDGPALIGYDGGQQYYRNGRLHRIDGPASIRADGSISYWIDGKIPTTILDLILTDREMIFDCELVSNVRYTTFPIIRAYRFTDPDELILAQLYYS